MSKLVPLAFTMRGKTQNTGTEIYPCLHYSSVYLSQTLINPGDKTIKKAISHATQEVLINGGFYTSSPE